MTTFRIHFLAASIFFVIQFNQVSDGVSDAYSSQAFLQRARQMLYEGQ